MINRIIKKTPLIFFYLFLLTIPLQTRMVFSLADIFNEYTSYFLYLSDIFLIITLISWFVNAVVKFRTDFSLEKSNLRSNPKFYYRVKPHYQSNKKSLFIIHYSLFIILIWSFLTLLWTQNVGVGVFRAIKLAEFALLFLFVTHNIKTQKHLFWTTLCITATGFFQAIIGIWQYFIQHSTGLKWLGETILSPNMPGVAKIEVAGQKIMRAYGTFPHPNVFAGFLLLSITCGLLVMFMIGRPKPQNSFWSNSQYKRVWQFIVSKLIPFIIALQIIALILTFSRTAWIVALLFYCFIVLLFYCHRKELAKSLKWAFLATTLVILVSAAVFWPQISSRLILGGQALRERGLYNSIAFSMIKESPIWGIGMGNFVAAVRVIHELPLQLWQYQPVHNIYLLIWAELGIIGLILFAFFIFHVLKTAWLTQKTTNVSRETSRDSLFIIHYSLFIVLIAFLFIGLFDHYFWTLQQGGLIFWLVLALVMVQFNNHAIHDK